MEELHGLTCAGGSLLGGFLELIVRRLLLEDLGKDTLELAADALFPLVLSHMSAFQSIGECSCMDMWCLSVCEEGM